MIFEDSTVMIGVAMPSISFHININGPNFGANKKFSVETPTLSTPFRNLHMLHPNGQSVLNRNYLNY